MLSHYRVLGFTMGQRSDAKQVEVQPSEEIKAQIVKERRIKKEQYDVPVY
jgi:hypothetical protein